ncbi:uncharacterized protein O3C94_002972 [Discoglossus pictus]
MSNNENSHKTSSLTVENVTRLEQEYGTAEDFLPVRRNVEEYIRKTQQLLLEESQRPNVRASTTQTETSSKTFEFPLVKSGEKPQKGKNNSRNAPPGDERKKEIQAKTSTDVITKNTGMDTSSNSEGFIGQMTFERKNMYTQTEWSLEEEDISISDLSSYGKDGQFWNIHQERQNNRENKSSRGKGNVTGTKSTLNGGGKSDTKVINTQQNKE